MSFKKSSGVKANGCVVTVALLQTPIQPLFPPLPQLTVTSQPPWFQPLLQVSLTLYIFKIHPVMYINKNNSPLSFYHSCNQHEFDNSLPLSRPSQEHLRRRELHRRHSAGSGPAGCHLLPLQILQVQGPQLPHPLKQPHIRITCRVEDSPTQHVLSTTDSNSVFKAGFLDLCCLCHAWF